MSTNVDWQTIMPDAWRVFFRFRTPRLVQATAMPHVIRGTPTLISGPTASGKTEAAFAPLYQRHVSFRRSDLSVIYVAPTKALVNDMYSRLGEYFSGASGDLIQRYTGDHHDFSNPSGKFAVLCTPEALDSLQLVQPELLSSVRAVVCDELHLLHGTARGQQLRSVLARVRHGARPAADRRDNFQTVAMTATVQDRQSVAELWLGSDAEVVHAGEPRAIEMEFVRAESDGIAAAIATQLQANPRDKILLFANTRNQAHELAAALSGILAPSGWPVYLHIGILARGERERIEHAMKHERRGVCVATSTLEVGIDIGDIDVVVLCQPPRTVSSFLQRLGRGNRRSGTCIVWAVVTNATDEDLYRALLHCGANGVLDDVHEYHRYSVDFQQLISLAWIGVKKQYPLTLNNCLERSGFSVPEESAVDALATGVLRDVHGALVPNDDWMDVGDQRRIHSVIVGGGGVPIYDMHSGETIGVANGNVVSGLIFTGTRMQTAAAQDGSGVYVETRQTNKGRRLAKLPMSYGRRRGQSRQLVWALATIGGHDPRAWVRQGSSIVTWGGDDYNLLLRTILTQGGIHGKLSHSSTSITGLMDTPEITPERVRSLAREVLAAKRIPADIAAKFREATAFTNHLSAALRRKEAEASIPTPGFLRWLDECSGCLL